MSGGVDSSVAACLLMDQGYECAGVTLKLHNENDQKNGRAGGSITPREGTCCSLSDIEDAKSVAHKLGFPHDVLHFTEDFDEWVVRRFADAYQRGETPNPCIDCNRFIKFNTIIRRADEMGFDSIATGHYVRREYDAGSGRYILKKGLDSSKDQSYVLYSLNQNQLSRTLFPLGELSKSQVREIAVSRDFINARKKDSQDICFVPDGDYGAFLERYLARPLVPGNFISPDGKIIGQHRGTPRYTLGQRKGLGLAQNIFSGNPGYVCNINPSENTVTVGEESLLFGADLDAYDINLIACSKLDGDVRLRAKIRYRHTEQPCTVRQTGEDTIHVTFDEPQRAITPGQAVVLYDGDTVVGGGTIHINNKYIDAE